MFNIQQKCRKATQFNKNHPYENKSIRVVNVSKRFVIAENLIKNLDCASY